jgi:hypothetical protein
MVQPYRFFGTLERSLYCFPRNGLVQAERLAVTRSSGQLGTSLKAAL